MSSSRLRIKYTKKFVILNVIPPPCFCAQLFKKYTIKEKDRLRVEPLTQSTEIFPFSPIKLFE